KCVPPVVFGAPQDVRGAFVQGLFDTDGSVGGHNVRYTTASRRLAGEVHQLLLSLGIVSVLSRDVPGAQKVTVRPPTGLPVPRAPLTHSLLPAAISGVLSRNYFFDRIVAVERLTETAEMYDLEVEGHHSFVVNGFVCHNSQGSEYPAIVIPLHTQHFLMLQR